MDYKKFGNHYVIQLDPDDEMVECICKMCETEGVALATISGFGAVKHMRVGVWDTQEKVFIGNDFEGKYEITSFIGNVTRMDGQVYLHAHMAAGDETGAVVGGHLISALVSATAELVLTSIDGTMQRRFCPVIGLNRIVFD